MSIAHWPTKEIKQRQKEEELSIPEGGRSFKDWLEQTSGYPQQTQLQRQRPESTPNSVLYQSGQGHVYLWESQFPHLYTEDANPVQISDRLCRASGRCQGRHTQAVVTSLLRPWQLFYPVDIH